MSRSAKRIDGTVLGWLRTRGDPAALLRSLEESFATRSGKLGYMITGEALCRLDEGVPDDDIDYIDLTQEGLITGSIRDETTVPALNWGRGVLSVWNGDAMLPDMVKAQLEGRLLTDVVSHPYLPSGARIVDMDASGSWLRLFCEGYSVPIDEAHETLAVERMNVLEGKKR